MCIRDSLITCPKKTKHRYNSLQQIIFKNAIKKQLTTNKNKIKIKPAYHNPVEHLPKNSHILTINKTTQKKKTKIIRTNR